MRGPMMVTPGFESRSSLIDPLFCKATTLLKVSASALALASAAAKRDITRATVVMKLRNGGTFIDYLSMTGYQQSSLLFPTEKIRASV